MDDGDVGEDGDDCEDGGDGDNDHYDQPFVITLW
jgi:hypothetical protein